MTQTPNDGSDFQPSDNEKSLETQPTPPPPRRKRRWLLWSSLLLLAGVGGGLTYGWIFIHQKLAPLVAKSLATTLNRPVKVGDVEGFSLRGISFGASAIPQVESDNDWARVEGVRASFDPLKLLLDRDLELQVTLVNPTVYLEQDSDGAWVATNLSTQGGDTPVDITLQTIRLENAAVELVPRLNGELLKPVAVTLDSGSSNFLNDYKLVQFELDGSVGKAEGDLKVKGEARVDTGETDLEIDLRDINVAAFAEQVFRGQFKGKPLPVNLETGQLSGKVEVALRNNQLDAITGKAKIEDFTTKLTQQPKLPVAKSQGNLNFTGKEVKLEDFTTTIDTIEAAIIGEVGLESGFNLTAKTKPTNLQQLLKTAQLEPKLPLPVTAEVESTLLVKGSLQQPQFSALVNTTKPSQVDKLQFSSIRGGAQLVEGNRIVADFRAIPTLGGVIRGKGQVLLTDSRSVVLNLKGSNLPTEAIATTYGSKLPISVGNLAAEAQIIGSLNQPNAINTVAIAQLDVAGGKAIARDLQVQQGKWSGQVQLSGVQLARVPQLPPELQSGTLAGNFNVSGKTDALKAENITATGAANLNFAGGRINAQEIQVSQGRWRSQVQAKGLQLTKIPALPKTLQQPGDINGEINISGTLESFAPETITAQGSAIAKVAGGQVVANNLQLKQGRWQSNLNASGIELNRLANLPLPLQGNLNGSFQAKGNLDNLTPAGIQASGNANLTLPNGGGRVSATNLQLTNNRWQAKVQTQGLQLARLTPQIPSSLRGSLVGQFDLNGSLANLSPEAINGSGRGQLKLAGGEVDASAKLNQGDWQATVIARDIESQRLAPLFPANLRQYTPQLGDAAGTFNLAGNLGNLKPEALRITGNGSLEVAGAQVKAQNLRLVNGNLETVIIPENVPLSPFAEQLRGNVAGRVKVTGNINNLNPQKIAAEGNLSLSEGVALIPGTLNTNFNWNGDRLTLQQLQAPGLAVDGYVDLNLAQAGLDSVEQFNLNVNAQNLDLAQISPNLPDFTSQATLAGTADFNGTITGTPQAPNVNGDIDLRNIAVSAPPNLNLQFDPLLTGTITSTAKEGSSLNLVGSENDRIQVALAADYLPQSLLVELDGFMAKGKRRRNQLDLTTANLPLAPVKEFALFVLEKLPNVNLDLPPQLINQRVAGNLSSDLEIDLETFASSGKVQITNPAFGSLTGENLTANFGYQNGKATIETAVFQHGDSEYRLTDASFQTTSQGPIYQATLKVEEGDIQKILTSVDLYSFNDLRRYTEDSITLGSSSNLQGITIGGNAESPLETQLGRLAIVQAIGEQQAAQRAASPIPELNQLTGKFGGEATISGSPTAGIVAEFDFQGEEWEWDTYEVEKVTAKGDYKDGILTILPARLEFTPGESLISFSGSVGGETQSGQLRLKNVPVDLLQEVVELPPTIALSGVINGNASLAGSKDNPQARGEIEINNAVVNGEPIKSANGSFAYNNSRLEFVGRSVIKADTDPLTISGGIPYKLPFARVEPEDKNLKVEVDVENEGLILIDILTNGQLAWSGGKGKVDLDIDSLVEEKQGRQDFLSNLDVKGSIKLEDAIIASQFLPDEQVTDINGTISFQDGIINFQSEKNQEDNNAIPEEGSSTNKEEKQPLTGNFGEGKIIVRGSLPISEATPISEPLMVNLQQLALDLKGIYEGGVSGDVKIAGTAVNPNLSGEVTLSDGQILLPETSSATQATASGDGTRQEDLELSGLKLILGDRVEIAKPPLLNFLADGELLINGTVANPIPKGDINLKSGQVNLFATQLRLDGNYNNKAVFDGRNPDEALDPTLDLRLVTDVTELDRQPVARDPNSAEVSLSPDFSLTTAGGSQTVRIQASVFGRASQLSGDETRIVQLNSVPRRSQTEIVSLLGGSFINNFAQDATLGIANLASSAVFGSLQDSIRDTVGLSEFRVFPTSVPNGESNDPELTLGVEAGVNITNQLSVSVLQIFAEDRPAQYSLQYRINENIILRSTTDLSGNNGAAIQYETRF